MTKEFKEYKFQQKLNIEFTKDENVFKETIFVDSWLISDKKIFDDINFDKLLDKQQNELSERRFRLECSINITSSTYCFRNCFL